MKKLIFILILTFSLICSAKYRTSNNIQVSGFRMRDYFGGITLFKDDLDNSLLRISGTIENDFPLKGVFVSIDNGKTYSPARFEGKKFVSNFLMKKMGAFLVIKVKFTDESGEHHWKINYQVRYIDSTIKDYLTKRTIDLFNYIERGQGDLALNMFSREYPFYYALEDKFRAIHRSLSTIGFRLFTVCTKSYDSNRFSVDMEWDRLKDGNKFHGFSRIFYKRNGEGVKIYRIKGDFPF